MADDLVTWVHARLDADDAISDDATLLILAALEGKHALADMAGYTPPLPPEPVDDETEPIGAFLKRITVAGFRGIGPRSQLNLDPQPSLTVISGRNGSGKSSFAEALEVALTGNTYRWSDDRPAVWRQHWRNIHDDVRVVAMHGTADTRTYARRTEKGIGELVARGVDATYLPVPGGGHAMLDHMLTWQGEALRFIGRSLDDARLR